MYGILSALSFLLRAGLCYLTIETTPLFANDTIPGFILGQAASLYFILWAISYSLVGRVYERGSEPTIGAILYFCVYIILTLILWGILALLTFFHVLPIHIG